MYVRRTLSRKPYFGADAANDVDREIREPYLGDRDGFAPCCILVSKMRFGVIWQSTLAADNAAVSTSSVE